MKKILSFFAAMLVAVAANAAVINIDPSTDNAIQGALNSAASGDEIVLAAGTYNESGNYLAFTGKELTVRAAEGAEVIIKTVCPVRLKEGAKAEFVNVKFDCSTIGSYEYVIVAADDTENKRVVLKGCEFYGWEKNKAMIEATSERRLASVTIDGCYFHNCMKSVVFIENTGSIDLSIKNSTFANISTNTESFWAGVIDSRATAGSVLVDHCTFYNVNAMNTDYAAIGKIKTPGAVVSNSIFVMPTATDGVRAIRDVAEAKNCITFNYSYDEGKGIHSDVTKTNCIQEDPKFVNAAEGNFNLGEGSPALTLNDGQPIGDPRWVPAPVEPKMKTIYCKMTQDWWTKDGAAVACYTWNDQGEPKAVWPGERMTPVEGETDVWSIELDVNTYHMCIFIRVNGEGDVADWGAKTGDLTIPTDDNNMFTITNDDPTWGDPGCTGVWSKYEPAAPVVDEWVEIAFSAPATADEIAADASFTVDGFTVAITDPDNKMSIDANDCRFGTATDYKMYSHRLKSGGKSTSTKNFITLTIPEAGTLRIAVRTGSGSATDRNLVLKQGDDTLYNQVIVETMAVKVMEGETEESVYPFVEVPVEAGTVALSYPVGSLNFYAFAFKAAGGVTPQPENPIDHTYFATGGGWDPDNESSAVWDPETGKITVTLALAKVAAWQSQVFVNAVKAEPGKFYDFSVKMKANKNVNGATIKWQENNNDPIMVSEISTINLVADQEFVYSKEQIAGVDGNGQLVFDFGYAEAGTIIEIYDLVIGEAESAEHTYTVAGSSETAFGTTWDPTNTANDMIKLEDGTYKWEKTGLTLAAGDVKFKVCQDHDWAVAYPAQDYVLNIPEAGIYTITITYNPEGNVVAADAVKTGEAVVIPTVAMHGNFTGEWKDTENFTLAEGNATASLKLTIAAGKYEFGMRIGGSGNWTANGAAFSRESNSAVIESGQGNLKLAADVDGEYTFTWTYETNTLSIAFPTSTGISNTNADVKAVKLIENGQIVIIRNGEKFNVQGQVIR